MGKDNGPRILTFDIETAPLLAHVWGLRDQNIGLNQVKSDRHLLAWAAKWKDESRVLYADQRRAKRIEDDSKLVLALRDLLDEADVVITQNGKQFDAKIVNARLAFHGLTPPSPFKHIDTCQLARRHFGFTSNKLEYLSDKLNTKYKKLSHPEFGGFTLWRECLAGNIKAWREMEKYNKHDVLATEELYEKLAPWGTGVNFDLFREGNEVTCNCGHTEFQKQGFAYTPSGKYQIHKCKKCGSYIRGRENLFDKDKRKSLRGVA